MAGLVAAALAAGMRNGTADEVVTTAALSESRAVLSGLRTRSIKNAERHLDLIGGRLERTRGTRLDGRNLNASTLAMRFSGDTPENSATFETRRLLAPEKERRTRRTAVWFGGNVTLDSARAEKPRFATVYTDGLAFGVDTRFGRRLLVGNAVGMAFDRTGIGDGGTLATRYLSNTLYGSLTTATDTYLDVAVGASRGTFRRQDGTGFFDAGGSPATQVFGLARHSRTFRRDKLRFRSYGQAKYLQTYFGSCRTPSGVYFASSTAQSLELTLGLRGETSRRTNLGKVSPHAVLEISRTMKSRSGTTLTFAESIEDLAAASTSRSGKLSARTGLNWALSDSTTINGEYAISSALGEFNARQKVTASFKLKF
ncbi:autotransporter outer membrane beta-barrel domain-containing protein [Nitratireductor sp. GCM10026969]|uniref:autotransporter outer membrane beta-barrel domain-containing protein n=1 Tax=Nitratireductor sp. GCM10026969 TaxID=3252645 RepID=UPI0036076B23